MPYERGHPQRSEQGLVEDPKGRQEERVYRRIAGSAALGRALATNQRRKTADAVYISRSSEANSLADRNSRRHASRGPSSANLSNTLAVQQWACPGCPPVGPVDPQSLSGRRLCPRGDDDAASQAFEAQKKVH
jgi:hypothetical protein